MHFDCIAVDSQLPVIEDTCAAATCIADRLLLGMQGFASGDLERDAQAVRLFTDAGLELLLSQVGLDARPNLMFLLPKPSCLLHKCSHLPVNMRWPLLLDCCLPCQRDVIYGCSTHTADVV